MAGVPVITGASLVFDTVRLKAAKLTDAVAVSVTLMTISEVVPTSTFVGVPVKVPVEVLKVAQLGLLVMLKVCRSLLFISVTVGVKVYAESSIAALLGEPLMTGAKFVISVIVGISIISITCVD